MVPPAIEPAPQRAQTEASLGGEKKVLRVQTTVSDFGSRTQRTNTSKSAPSQRQNRLKQHPTFLNKLSRSLTEPTKNILRRQLHLNWSWEVSGVLLSIICTALMAAILFVLDDKPLSTWKISIQPNSLIAVFSTIAKTALLVPVSECISQLKWIYFEKPRPLSQMQVFDDASRGPWGSLIFLQKARFTLGTLGALVTILALAFEPFAQQVIEFPLRMSPMRNESGTVALADSWSDSAFSSNNASSLKLNFNFGIIGEVVGRPLLTPVFDCPTSDCSFPDFTSLATCASCEVKEMSEDDGLPCQFSTTGFKRPRQSEQFRDSIDMHVWNNRTAFREGVRSITNFTVMETNCTIKTAGYPNTTLIARYTNSSQLVEIRSDSNGFGQFLVGSVLPLKYDYGGRTTEYYQQCRTETFLQDFEDGTTIEKYTCFKMRPDYTRVGNTTKDFMVNTFFKGNATFCRMHMCAREYKGVTIRNGEMRVRETNEYPLKKVRTEGVDEILQADDTTMPFFVGNASRGALSYIMRNATMAETPAIQDFLMPYLQDHEWEDFYNGVANVYTAVFRSHGNVNMLTHNGTAFGLETYVEVRWGWFFMPLGIVVLSLVFLICTIVRSHRREHLFKSSVLAAFFHPLNGWQKRELKITTRGEKERARAMLHRANTMPAALKRDIDGFLKFERQP